MEENVSSFPIYSLKLKRKSSPKKHWPKTQPEDNLPVVKNPPRTFSPQQMFLKMAEDRLPRHAFSNSAKSFDEWKSAALPEVLATLGDWPATVPPNPELMAEWTDRGVRKTRYHIDVGPHASAGLQVNTPENLPVGSKAPAIQCWHGHGDFGKDPVMGNAGNKKIEECIRTFNYDYGHQMAAHGFVTYAIDWIGRGDRDDTRKPFFSSAGEGRDWCNIYYLHATMLGMTSLSINLAHGKAATDFVSTLPQVDGGRLGVMGLSGGGTMALWTALTDRRMTAAEIICYSNLWATFGIADINYCGMQVAPGLFKLVDLPDLQGLLAPMPLLIDIGAYDSCFHVDSSLACYRQLEKIYAAASASSNLELDFFPGEHAWGGNLSPAFFKKQLS